MKVIVIPVTPFQQNCSLLICEETARCAVVDPGGDLDAIVTAIEKEQLKPEKILVTHGHVDHAAGVAGLARRLRIPVEGPQRGDKFWIESLAEHGGEFGFDWAEAFEPDRWLEDGDTVSFGNIELTVLHCPGHTPGHVVFYHADSKLAIVGDVLFRGSIGRTDFPRGDYNTLIHSIHDKLWPLGDEVRFVSGHGPASSFGFERQTNPFVGDRAGH